MLRLPRGRHQPAGEGHRGRQHGARRRGPRALARGGVAAPTPLRAAPLHQGGAPPQPPGGRRGLQPPGLQPATPCHPARSPLLCSSQQQPCAMRLRRARRTVTSSTISSSTRGRRRRRRASTWVASTWRPLRRPCPMAARRRRRRRRPRRPCRQARRRRPCRRWRRRRRYSPRSRGARPAPTG